MEILNQWLEELAGDLQRISPEDREAILESYREQINEMVSCGIKESDILSEIGSPKQVAKEVLESFIVDEALEEEVNVWKGPSRETNRGDGDLSFYCLLVISYDASFSDRRLFYLTNLVGINDCSLFRRHRGL